jgi:HK97 family phage major capsid protein
MSGVMRMRVERLADERDRTDQKLQDLLSLAEEETRPLNEYETEQAEKYRTQIADFETEIEILAADIDRQNASRDVSELLRSEDEGGGGDGEGRKRRYATPRSEVVVYRTFAEYARDKLILEKPQYVAESGHNPDAFRAEAEERMQRTLQNVTSTTVAGLITPTHMTEILDIIDRSRPVVDSGRDVPLDRGSMTYPKIGTRPTTPLQSAEKTEAGTIAPTVTSETLTAQTYLGAVNISWQALNWSNPNVLELYLDLAAEAYARQTESVACEALETSAIGTVPRRQAAWERRVRSRSRSGGRLWSQGCRGSTRRRAAVTARTPCTCHRTASTSSRRSEPTRWRRCHRLAPWTWAR